MMAPARGPVQHVNDVQRGWRLRRRHLAQVPRSFGAHVADAAITLLRDICGMALKVRVGKNLVLQNARHLVASATQRALRPLERDHCLIGDKIRQRSVAGGGRCVPFAQFVEIGTVADHVSEPLGSVPGEPAPAHLARFGHSAVEEIPQRAGSGPA